MLKKMMLLATAIAALAAFAMPTVANAQQLKEGVTPLPVGAKFTATSTNVETHTLLGSLSCTHVLMHLEVNVNNAGTSRATAAAGQTTTKECFLGGLHIGTPVTITDAKTTAHVHLTGANAGKAQFTFVADIGGPGGTECHEATNGTAGSITWVTNTDTIHVIAPTASPGCGPAELTGDFTVFTEGNPKIPITVS